MRRILAFLVLTLLAAAAPAGDGDKGFTPLFNGKDLSGWSVVPEKAKAAFTVRDLDKAPVLVADGKRLAYIHTVKSFKNYVLRLEFKSGKASRSGVLLHVTPPHKIWPACVQTQIQENDDGRVFAFGGADGKFSVDRMAQRKAIKPGEWNGLEIRAKDGRLTSKINGVEISAGVSDLSEGPIGLQAEMGEVLFKNVRIKID
jgi:hypothetical protein